MVQRLRRRLSVRVRLTLWSAGVLGLTLLALGIAIRVVVHEYLYSSVDRELESRVFYFRPLHRRFDRPPPDRNDRMMRPPLRSRFVEDPYAPRFYDRLGKATGHTGEMETWDTQAVHSAALNRAIFSTVEREGDRIRLYTAPVLNKQREVASIIQVPLRLTDIDRGMEAVDHTLLALLPVALALTVTGSAVLTSRALRPIEEALEQEKRFVADASHELRTPIAIIRSAVEIGLEADTVDGTDPRALRRALERVDVASNRTRRIVDDLLLLARTQETSTEGKTALPLFQEPIYASELLTEARTLYDPVLVGRVITLDVFPEDLCLVVDRHHLGRVLSNLIDNAVRHTSATDGRIVLSAQKMSRDRVALTVEDNGEGISATDLPHLFRRFYRADNSRMRAKGGTGLGLSIVKAIVEAHRGTLEIRSTPGTGTRVTIYLPHG